MFILQHDRALHEQESLTANASLKGHVFIFCFIFSFKHLFMSCGGSNKGINFKDTVCCLVLVTSGFTEEKVRCELPSIFLTIYFSPYLNLHSTVKACAQLAWFSCLRILVYKDSQSPKWLKNSHHVVLNFCKF